MSEQLKRVTTPKKEPRYWSNIKLNRSSAHEIASKLETQAANLLRDLEDFHAVLLKDVANMSDGTFALLAEAEFQLKLSLHYFQAIKRSLGSKGGCGRK